MKRFIRYLYEYEEGRRIRNVGFVKVDQQEQECMIHIYGKGLHLNMGETLELYLFYEENGLCVGVWQGEITNINPAVNYRLHYTEEDTGEAENFSKIRGIVLKNHGDRKYAAVWDDMPADVEHMKIWERKEEPIEMEEEVEEEKTENVIDIEAKPEITFDDFEKLQFQVGEIIACEEVKKSRKLLCSQVKIGSQVRQIVSGIKAHYSAEEMVGKKVMVVTNLKPAKLAGILSEGMILCAEDADGNLSLMVPEKEMPAGAEIC